MRGWTGPGNRQGADLSDSTETMRANPPRGAHVCWMDYPSLQELFRRTGIALLVLAALALALYLMVVTRLIDLGGLGRSNLVPWYSTWDPRVSIWTVAAVLVGAYWVRSLPRLLRRTGSAGFLLRLAGLALVFWGGVALSDGAKVGESREGLVPANGITYPFWRTAHEYIGDVPKVDEYGVRGLMAAWPTDEVQNRLAWHSRTHPPGSVILLWGVRQLFGGGPLPAALAVMLLGSLSLVAAWGFARLFLPEMSARLVALFFSLAPNTVLFFATSMETVFTLLGLSALALMTASYLTEERGRGTVLAVLGGAVLAAGTFFTWSMLLVVVMVAALEGIALFRRGGRSWGRTLERTAVQVIGFAAVTGVLVAMGYNPMASLSRALAADEMMMGTGTESVLRVLSIGVANLTAWSIGLGLASIAMLGSLVAGRRAALREGTVVARFTLPTPMLAASFVLAFAAFSTLYTLEVERIWIMLNVPVLVGLFATLEREMRAREARDESGRKIHAPFTRTAFVQLWAGLLIAQTILIEVLTETRW